MDEKRALNQRNRKVAATFLSKYYTLWMTDPQQLLPMYGMRAQFKHNERHQASTGVDQIRVAISSLYGRKQGRVTVMSMEPREEDTSGTIKFVVLGTFHPATRELGTSTFRHLIELREHYPGSNSFFIYSDILVWESQQMDFSTPWSAETPPMFAKPAPERSVSPLQVPSEVEDSVARNTGLIGEQLPSAAPTAQPDPLAQDEPLLEPENGDAEGEATAANQKCEEVAPHPAAQTVQPSAATTAAAATPAMPPPTAPPPPPPPESTEPPQQLTYAERVRLGGIKTRSPPPDGATDANKVVSAVVPAAPTDPPSKRAAPTSRTTAPGGRQGGGKRSGEEEHTGANVPQDDPPKRSDGTQRLGGAAGPARRHGFNVIYYDCILKGLHRDTTVDELAVLVDPYVPIIKSSIKLESKTDSRLEANTRTFAFIQFDPAALESKGYDVDQAITDLRRRKLMLHNATVIVDRVREKYEKY